MLPPDRLADLLPQEARTSGAAGFSICGALMPRSNLPRGEGCALSALSALSLHTGCAKPSCPYYTKSENALARRERPGDEINEINEISYLSQATLGWLYSKGERGALRRYLAIGDQSERGPETVDQVADGSFTDRRSVHEGHCRLLFGLVHAGQRTSSYLKAGPALTDAGGLLHRS